MNSEFTHTPGPWVTSFGKYTCQIETQDTSHGALDALLVAEVGMWNDHTEPTYLANARLVSAAPDLLDACKTADAFFDHLSSSWEVCDHTKAMIAKVKSAIAKAEDKSPNPWHEYEAALLSEED